MRMYAACILIGPATLGRMYVEEVRTTDQIAAHLGCSGTTVLRHLRRFKIPVRPRGPSVDWVHLRKRLSPTLPEWSADVAYVIGLIATDGNLARKRPVITIVSKDTDLLETIRRCLGLITPIKSHPGGLLSARYRFRTSISPTAFAAVSMATARSSCIPIAITLRRTSAMSTNVSTCPSSRRAGLSSRARSFRLETSLRESAIHTAPSVDVLLSERFLP